MGNVQAKAISLSILHPRWRLLVCLRFLCRCISASVLRISDTLLHSQQRTTVINIYSTRNTMQMPIFRAAVSSERRRSAAGVVFTSSRVVAVYGAGPRWTREALARRSPVARPPRPWTGLDCRAPVVEVSRGRRRTAAERSSRPNRPSNAARATSQWVGDLQYRIARDADTSKGSDEQRKRRSHEASHASRRIDERGRPTAVWGS